MFEVFTVQMQTETKYISWKEIPVHPWTKLVTDILHFEGAYYMLKVDYTSRFPIVHKLSSLTGVHVANQCKLIFSEYTWPETLFTENGPCYTSQAFTSVMQSYNVNYITSCLHDLQSKRLVEKYIQIPKSLLYKAKYEGTDFYKCVSIYYTTPLQVVNDHLCRFSNAGMLDLTYPCQMLLGNSLVTSLK